MDIEEARGLAAQAWCKPMTEHKIMDVELAEAFAEILVSEVGKAGTPPSQIRINAEKDPTYAPFCLRCRTMCRMAMVEPFFWRCSCGAEHDERIAKGG